MIIFNFIEHRNIELSNDKTNINNTQEFDMAEALISANKDEISTRISRAITLNYNPPIIIVPVKDLGNKVIIELNFDVATAGNNTLCTLKKVVI